MSVRSIGRTPADEYGAASVDGHARTRPFSDVACDVGAADVAANQIEDAQADVDEPTEMQQLVADEGCHRKETLVDRDAGAATAFSSVCWCTRVASNWDCRCGR
jgi:hypothetical protein